MSYDTNTAEIRPDLQAVVEDAMSADEGYIGQALLPYVGYSTRTGEYKRLRLRTGQLLRKTDGTGTLRAPRTAYPRITGTDEADNFSCKDRGLEEAVDDTEKADKARFYQLEAVALKRVTRTMRLDHEIRVRDKIMDTNVFPTQDPVVAYDEANSATIDFLQDIKNAKRGMVKMGERPNTIAMSDELWDVISMSKLLSERMFGVNSSNKIMGAGAVSAYLSEMLQMPINLLVGQAAYEDTKKKAGKAASSDMSWVWPDTHIWMGCVAGGLLEMGGAGRTIVWEEDSPGFFVTESYREENIRSEMVRVRHNTDEKIVNENCGILIPTGRS
jgi:hypothetical protein|tara:strand:+ start:405 stop:1391 length:987 start_codon:yes stop_codon:yes gene_type:complete